MCIFCGGQCGGVGDALLSVGGIWITLVIFKVVKFGSGDPNLPVDQLGSDISFTPNLTVEQMGNGGILTRTHSEI